MNKENIQKGIDYLEANYDDISKRFDMLYFRNDELDDDSPICSSVGCLVGHLTAIDADNINQNFKDSKGCIRFNAWSEDFFDLLEDVDAGDDDWYFMFDSAWSKFPETGTLQQGINRMKYMLKHGQTPKYWEYGETYE